MYNKKIFIFISGLFYGGLFTVFFREFFIIYYNYSMFMIIMICLWGTGTYLGIKSGGFNKTKTDSNIKNITLWIFLSIILILYFIKLTENLKTPITFKIHLLFILSILFSPLLLGFLIKIISKIFTDNEKYSVNLLLFGIGVSPIFLFYINRSGLNNWFGAISFGIIYIGFLILFIEKGRNRILPILYVVPVFAFAILGNNNILRKESSGFHLIKYFETETGQYFVVDKNKRVYFYRNFKKLFKFPYSDNKIKKILKEKNMKFGDILILNNNPAIINSFTATGLFNIDFFLGEKEFYYNLSYDFPTIIRSLLESNVKIIKSKETKTKKIYDLILLPEYNPKEIFSEYYYNTEKLLPLIKKLKRNGVIISISKTDNPPFDFFDKIGDKIYELRKTEKTVNILKNITKKRDLNKLLIFFLTILLLYPLIFILRKKKQIIISCFILSILFIFFSFKIYIDNNFDLYNRVSLIFSSLFIGIWLGHLLLSNIKISKPKITLFSIFPFIILCFVLVNYIDLLFYISQFLFGFLFTGLFLSIKQKLYL